jgi:TfoX/Sxy family transcriptional regulator of competence genes
MPFDEKLAARLREALVDVPHVEEKKMFRGVTFMVNGKMCLTVSADELMCRIGAEAVEKSLGKRGTRAVIMRGRPMKDFIKINDEGFTSKKDFDHWVALALTFNKDAKASKKTKKKG